MTDVCLYLAHVRLHLTDTASTQFTPITDQLLRGRPGRDSSEVTSLIACHTTQSFVAD